MGALRRAVVAMTRALAVVARLDNPGRAAEQHLQPANPAPSRYHIRNQNIIRKKPLSIKVSVDEKRAAMTAR